MPYYSVAGLLGRGMGCCYPGEERKGSLGQARHDQGKEEKLMTQLYQPCQSSGLGLIERLKRRRTKKIAFVAT